MESIDKALNKLERFPDIKKVFSPLDYKLIDKEIFVQQCNVLKDRLKDNLELINI